MKLLCAIDGSRYSQWALDWLPRLSSPGDGSLLLVHAVDMTQFKPLPRLDVKTRSARVDVLECSFESAARLLEWAEVKAPARWGAFVPNSCAGVRRVRSPALPSRNRPISSASAPAVDEAPKNISWEVWQIRS